MGLPEGPEGLRLRAEEQALLQEELQRLQAQASQAAAMELAPLVEAVGRGEVSGDLLPSLQYLLWHLLESGLARALHRAEGERILMGLFRRTEVGQNIAQELESLNKALGAMRGQTVQAIQASMRLPGTYLIHIETEEMDLTLVVSREGVRLESVGV